MKKSILFAALVLILALVFVGCTNDNGNGDKDEPDPGFTITITGTPPAAGLVGASLMDPTASTVPVAVAILGTPPYEFKVAGASGMPTTEDFNTPGTYLLGVADMLGGNVHMYISGTGPGTLTFSATVTHHDLNWSSFHPAGQ